ncbi:MAG: hypothetical protein HY663_04460 [Chloroflexi bacterium]|nr:hypothetical protein [Chloroflexota bacterium]
MDTANALATSLQNQITSLQAITNLSASTALVSLASVNATASANATVASFTASYAGYLSISGNSSSASAYIAVTDSFIGYPYNSNHYPFGTANVTLTIPVLPGTVAILFGVPSDNATAIITATYNY